MVSGEALLAVLDLQLDVQLRGGRIIDHHQLFVPVELEYGDGGEELLDVGVRLVFGGTVVQIAAGLRMWVVGLEGYVEYIMEDGRNSLRS